MSKKESIKRYILLIIGLFVMAMGISLMVKAKLGTSPISSTPYVFSMKYTAISLGTFSFIWNIIMILGQIIILGKRFKKYEIIQIPLSVLFGVFIDIATEMIKWINPHNYFVSLFVLILGCVVLALGVSFTVIADVIMNSGEALVKAITIRNGKNFGDMKVVFDVSLVILAMIGSFIFFGEIRGVREGTVIAAVISGFIIKYFNKILKPRIDKILIDKDRVDSDMENCEC
ncbi:MAG TPA: hypothetical protein DG753_10000 [Clostridium sp.]|nr:hypothetical protein [Clostridium sp.]